jgi:UDP-N-acetylglucosamine 1-carboxyvinyltransferase
MGIDIIMGEDYLIVSHSSRPINVNIKTLGYPGFPTDLQQPVSTLLTQCEGVSVIEETIYENRFQNIPYLEKMGARAEIKGDKVFIKGPTKLHGEEVEATDLRAGACLVLAGLIAEGATTITNVDHILRGYQDIVEKLQAVGAKITVE